NYPSFQSEVDIVKGTTTDVQKTVNKVLDQKQVLEYQHLVRRVPVADNVIEYAVGLVHKTRVDSDLAPAITKDYVEWGAGPRASQNLIIAAKCHALLNHKYSPDIEDVKAVANPILRHRIVRNFKAEAEGITIDKLIESLL
ncbi:MAG: MoxR-like ATPase, partial [Candidatus Endobugula sp.]